MLRMPPKLFLCLLLSMVLGPPGFVKAQTATYHVHQEASSTAGLFQLRTDGPDTASTAVQSAELKKQPPGEYLIKAFDTQAGDPNTSGEIPAGSQVTFTLWMKKTAKGGTMFPRGKLHRVTREISFVAGDGRNGSV